MELSDAWSTIPLAIWGICSAFVLFVIASAAIQRRTLELIHGGVFLKVLAVLGVISVAVFNLHSEVSLYALHPLIFTAISAMGAMGSLMIVRGLLR